MSQQIERLTRELDHLIRAKYPVIVLETPEEDRAVALVRAVAALPRHRDKPVCLWSVAGGLRRLEPAADIPPTTGLVGANGQRGQRPTMGLNMAFI